MFECNGGKICIWKADAVIAFNVLNSIYYALTEQANIFGKQYLIFFLKEIVFQLKYISYFIYLTHLK